MIGTTIGKYRIVGKLGRGGMGTVYKAVDETLDREVAIKVLNSEGSDAKLMARFRAEATTLARLNHPQIATIYEVYQTDGDLLMVMELVRGETLDALSVRSGPLPAEQAGALVAQILGGLSHAHRAGIVHRDLKPANVMLAESGGIKIMDFGIARVLGAEHLTSDGTMVGTPAYMAPEQIIGNKDIDARADLYSVGVVMYRLLTGCLPFQSDTAIGMVQKQLWDPPTPARSHREDLPIWCDPILTRALAKTPVERFQTADEFRSAVLSALGNSAERFATDSGTFTFTGVAAPTVVGAPPAVARDTVAGVTQVPAAPTGHIQGPDSPSTADAMTLVRGHQPQDPRTNADAAPIAGAPTLLAPSPPSATSVAPVPNPGSTSAPVSPNAASASPRRKPVAALGIAAVVVVVAVVAGAVLMTRRAPAPPPAAAAESTAANSPTEPAQPPEPPATPDTNPSQTEQADQARAAALPAAVVTNGASAGQTSGPARSGSAAPASAPSRAEAATGAKPAGAAAPPIESTPIPIATEPAAVSAAATLPPVSFGAQTVVVEGGKNRQRDTNVQLANGIVTVTGKDNKVMITVPYEAVVGATYSNSKQPLWNTPQGPAEVVHLDGGAFGFLKGDQNWVTLRTDGMSLVMRVRDQDSRRVVSALEERIGKKVETVDERKGR